MNGPLTPIGPRYIMSQARQSWEHEGPKINEGPEAIIDPNGQLHIVYSANPSWQDKYCLADLRLRKGWRPDLCVGLVGWDATLSINGSGHLTFALPNGDTNKSPAGVDHIPFEFHGVKKSKDNKYDWGLWAWFTGSCVWWSKTTYHRIHVSGDNNDDGSSFTFFE
ncbi:hypothetical protein BJ170DRAFT_733043 [Xylariales sp. AK1849]|nr:hypothetical protein BJ170DRAFT_733043 [Xylariales sp. AK1849]